MTHQVLRLSTPLWWAGQAGVVWPVLDQAWVRPSASTVSASASVTPGAPERLILSSGTAGGVDVALQAVAQIIAGSLVTAQGTLQPGSVTPTELDPANKQALALLDAWMSEPDDLGAGWWADFERELAENRPLFHRE